MKLAREGAYTGTIFHRVMRYGLIQGGDPLSRDPARTRSTGRADSTSSAFEPNAEKHTAGAVSAVLQPGQRDSAGAQFFVCISDQPTLDGQYTVFGRVVEGLEIVQEISAAPANAAGLPATRIEIKSVTIRDTPAEPFVNDTAATLAAHRATLETTMGEIELEMLPDKAPETVRRFLRLAQAGVYDGTAVHRVVPNFVIQTGALAYRASPLSATQQKLVVNMPPEFTDTPNVPGHRLDRARRRSGQRLDVVLHLHRPVPIARRQVHGVRARGQGHGRAHGDRRRSGRRRNAAHGRHPHARAALEGAVIPSRSPCCAPCRLESCWTAPSPSTGGISCCS